MTNVDYFFDFRSVLPMCMPHYVYLAECSDGSLYAGTCVDLEAREAKHNDGTGAKYTRGRKPVEFVYYEKCDTLSEARRREAEIKRMKKGEKMALIKGQGKATIRSWSLCKTPIAPKGRQRGQRGQGRQNVFVLFALLALFSAQLLARP